MFQGCGTAMVTPFRPDLSLDEEVMRRLVIRQLESGIHFLVPCGTTGENPTLTREEHLKGTLEVGKLADLIVLSRDLLTIQPEQILDTQVMMTVLGGKVVFERQ